VVAGTVTGLLLTRPPPAGTSFPAAETELRLVVDPNVPPPVGADVRVDVAGAVRYVRSVWDGPWARRVEVRVVAAAARLRAEAPGLGVEAGHGGLVAAVAVVPVGAAGTARPPTGGDLGRLVVDATAYRRLSAAGRQIVLRHELAHLASAASTPADMPIWLVEGFAEEVGHAGVVGTGPGTPDVGRAAVELASEVRAGHVPAALPGDTAFSGRDGRLAQTYQEAWLACRLLATLSASEDARKTMIASSSAQATLSASADATKAMGGLVRFYRSVAASRPPGAGLDAALRAAVGLSWPRFTGRWRAYLVAELATPAG
jgi:hypothetical protein